MAAPDQLDETTSMDREALVEAILDLERDRDTQLEDEGLAQDLSAHIKHYVDELVSLRGDGDVTEGDSADDPEDGGGEEGGGEDGGGEDGTDESDTVAQQQKRRKRKGRKKADLPVGPVPVIVKVVDALYYAASAVSTFGSTTLTGLSQTSATGSQVRV